MLFGKDEPIWSRQSNLQLLRGLGSADWNHAHRFELEVCLNYLSPLFLVLAFILVFGCLFG